MNPDEAAQPDAVGTGAHGSRPSIGEVVDRHRAQLHGIPGVLGVAIGRGPVGDEVIVIYVSTASSASIPGIVEGYRVETVATGPIDAL